VFCKLNHFIE
jgi:hypothetical protein